MAQKTRRSASTKRSGPEQLKEELVELLRSTENGELKVSEIRGKFKAKFQKKFSPKRYGFKSGDILSVFTLMPDVVSLEYPKGGKSSQANILIKLKDRTAVVREDGEEAVAAKVLPEVEVFALKGISGQCMFSCFPTPTQQQKWVLASFGSCKPLNSKTRF